MSGPASKSRAISDPEAAVGLACAAGLNGVYRSHAIAVAAASAFSARGRFGLSHPGRGRRDAQSIAAAIPRAVPNREPLLAACREQGLDAEQAAFAAACSLSGSAGGALWYFALSCNGVQLGTQPKARAPGEVSVADRLVALEAQYPTVYQAFRKGMAEPTFVPAA